MIPEHPESTITAFPHPACAFPNGLRQAAGAHCSVDALLLAAFAQGHDLRAADLGAGCGVIGLGLLLRGVAASVEAVELDPEQAACIRANADRLGLTARLQVVEADVSTARPGNPADLVICNPPWRLLGSQRPPRCPRRRQALFGTPLTLPLFVRAAAERLQPGGHFALLVGADRLSDALSALNTLPGTPLCPTRLRCVHPRPNRPAVFVLLEALRGRSARLEIEPPLVLHNATGRNYTPEAHAFCPWLKC